MVCSHFSVMRYALCVTRRILFLLVLLAFTGCEWAMGQFLGRPPVAERVAESLSGEIAVPAAPSVDSLSFRFAMFGDPQIEGGGESYLDWFRVDAAARDVDFFCVVGDLTNNATEAERASIKVQLDSVGLPYYCTVGNHDFYQEGGWDWFKTTFGPSCYAVAVGGKVKLLFLDTADGLLGQEQFEWLVDELDATTEPVKVVGTHFPIYDGAQPIMWRLAGTEERYKLTRALTKYGVHSFVSGHIHGWRHTVIEDVNHFICAMPAVGMDYGNPGYILFTWAGDSLSWEHIEVPQQ